MGARLSPATTAATTADVPRTLRRAAWLVIALFAALQVSEIFRYRTVGGDETYYMQAAWTMLHSGDWLVPRYITGGLRFEKPIATYWAVAGVCWVLGFSLWATRLHSVIFALATLPYVFGLARVTLRDRTQAWLAVIAYASIKSVHANAHQGRTDAILAFFCAAAMYHFARALFEGDRPRLDAVAGHAFSAGAILVKGLAGVLFTYLPLAVFVLVWRKRLARGRARALVSPRGIATAVLIAVPWFAYVLTTHRDDFLRIFTHDQVTANVGLNKPFFIVSLAHYAQLLLRETFPWWPLLLLALVADRDALRRVVREHRGECLLFLLWLGVAIAVLSIGNSSRGRYLLPTFPGVAVFVAAVLFESGPDGRMHRGLRWLLALLVFASLGVAGVFAAMQLGPLYPHDLPWVVWPVVALVVGALALGVRARRFDLGQSAAAVGALTLALLSVSNSVVEQPAPLIPIVELGRDVVAPEPADVRIAVLGQRPPQVATVMHFVSGHRPTDLPTRRALDEQVGFLRRFVDEPGRKLVVADDYAFDGLPDDLLQRLQLVDQRTALVEHGLRPDSGAEWLKRLGLRDAVMETQRLFTVVDPPR